MKNILILIITCFVLQCASLYAQTNRISDHNSIGWYNYFGTFKLSEHFGVHTEYQWRRDSYITDWQQSLLRVGINYSLNPRVLFRAGYAWVETFPYGDIPLNGFGKDFTEHRFFEMVQLSHKEGIVDISHRFMVEQRFVGKYNSLLSEKEDEYPLLNRMRYMIRLQAPLQGNEIKDNTPYIALYDELFMGFGENVNANIFDQNRIGVLLGYRFSPLLRIEGGYLSQIVQFGRQIGGKNVIQYNNGIILNANISIDLTSQ